MLRGCVTSTCPIIRTLCKQAWLSFAAAAAELSHLEHHSQPIAVAVGNLRHTLVDAFFITPEPVPTKIREMMARSVRDNWAILASLSERLSFQLGAQTEGEDRCWSYFGGSFLWLSRSPAKHSRMNVSRIVSVIFCSDARA